MEHQKEEELNGHHHSGDDTSDDEGHSLKKSSKEKESRKEEGKSEKESHDESPSSSISSSRSSCTSTCYHHRHRHDCDDGALAHGEEEEVGHHHSGDDTSDDEGHSLKKSSKEKESRMEEGKSKKESHDESPSSSISSSRSSCTSTCYHHRHRHDCDDGALAHGEEEEVSSFGGRDSVEDNSPEGSLFIPAIIEEQREVEKATSAEEEVDEEGASGTREESEDDESEVSDSPVYDKFLVETSLKEDQKRTTTDNKASLDRQESGNKYNVVISEAVDGIHNALEKHDDAPAPVAEVAESEKSEELVAEPSAQENSHENPTEESTVSSHAGERETSDAVESEAHADLSKAVEGNGIHHEADEAVKDIIEEQATVSEESLALGEFEANGIALESETGATDHTPEESGQLESKNGQDDGGIQSVRGHRELSVDLGSPLDHQKRYMRQFMTPSPPKRENSVYKIVMALEGLQVGEKCIHGEIDHGVCHQRYGDRRMSSSPSFSARAHRETSASPKEDDVTTSFILGRAESAEVRVSNGEKTEVDSDWSFVQHDSQSGVTTQQSSTVKTETYTDTVVFRRDDGFLPRTPGRSPLSGSQSMRAVFNQADASGSTTPRLKIVHEFPAERTDVVSAAVEGESEVERILRLQETHDLVCPVCRSCITKRVILRKRKRTAVLSTDDRWVTERVQDSDSEENVTEAPDNVQGDGDAVVEQYEDYGCWGCFTFLFRRERSVQRSQVVEVPRTENSTVSVATISQATDQSAEWLQTEPELVVSPPVLTDADYDNRCLPIFFTWRRKTTSPTDAEIVAPLLSIEEKETLSEESKSEEVVQSQARDVPELEDQTRESLPAAPEMQPVAEIQPPPDSEILELPAAPGPVEGVRLPVVVVESREDRLCFPFLWRRASKTTTAQPEILQPSLEKKVVTDQSEKQTSEVDQLSLRDTEQKSVVDKQQSGYVERRTEDFSRIEDDLWMRREVLLEVPVSVPPQEKLTNPDSSEAASESDTSFRTVRVTEAERKVDCLCFPSWSSSETTPEETESSRITDSSQVASSSKSSVITSSSSSKTAADSSVSSSAEIVLSSPSLKEAAILPVAPSPAKREAERATLNCMDILIPSYPWGPPGTGSRKEVLERSEEHSGTATSTLSEFSAVDQVVSNGVVTEQVASEGFTKLDSLAKKPQEEIFQTAFGSIKVPKSQAKESQGAGNEISTMRTEDSTCLPLLLPSLSWRRQEVKTGETLDEPAKIETAEKEAESKELTFGDIEVSRSQSGLQTEQIHNEHAAEVMDEEEVPLIRKPPTSKQLTPTKVEPLPAEEEKPQVVSPVEADDSSLFPEVVERDVIFSQDVTRTPELPRVDDSTSGEESREKGSWSCCLPSHSQLTSVSQDVTVSPSLPPVDVALEEERRETGSLSCCLPSYTQFAYQPKEDRVNGEEAVSGGRASDSYVSESTFHEEVSRETIVDARVTTQTTTTKSRTDATESESIDSVKVDTSVSYVHASVQHDKDAVEATLHLDDHPTFSLHPASKLPGAAPALDEQPHVTQPPLGPTYSTGYAALARFLEDEEENAEEDAEINERLVDSSQKQAEPFKPVKVIGHDTVKEFSRLPESAARGEIIRSGAVIESNVSTVLSEQDTKQEISRPERTQAQVPDLYVDQEEDRSCCLPSSKWRWGRSKLSSEAAHLREPLLGPDYAQSQVSDLIVEPVSKVDTKDSTQHTEETAVKTAVRDTEDESCTCLPWSGRRHDLEAQLREPLLQRDDASEQLLHRDSEVDSKSDSSAHVTIHQVQEVTHTTTGPTAEPDLPDEERCNCFPWSTRRDTRDSVEVDTTVTVASDDTVIEVEGTDAASTLAAAVAAAEDVGMMDGGASQSPELLKSVVYGGLDVSLASLGVVASAAGGDAKTRSILALGLANLIFGFIVFYYKIQDMHKESPARFQQSVGPRFWTNGPLAMLSFLFFGALPVLVFGFSFRELNDHDYKMAATVLVSTIAIVFLGCGKVAAKMTELSYRRTLTTLITTGIVAVVAGFYTGEYISKLLAKYGILDE